MIRKFNWLVLVGGVLLAFPAKAHLLMCDKTVNGQGIVHLNQYPAKLNYRMSVKNIHPDSPSQADTVSDPLLEAHGFNFSPQAPFTLALDEEIHSEFKLQVKSYEHCLSLAAQDGIADGIIDNVFSVSWDSGSAACSARVYCKEPPPPNGGGDCKHKDCKDKDCKHKDCKDKDCKHKDGKHKDCKNKDCKGKDCKGKDCKDNPSEDPEPEPQCKGGKFCKHSKNCKGGKLCPGLKKSLLGLLKIFFGKKVPR